jgi:hypothetical protein
VATGLEVDHAFIGCTSGAPQGDALLRLGFVEGSGNTHPGQGTANRRFYFDNFMLELVWVTDPGEACNERTRRTRLWERCEGQDGQVSPWAARPGRLVSGIALGRTTRSRELFRSAAAAARNFI